MAIAVDISNYTGRLYDKQLRWLKETAELVIVRLSTEDGGGQRTIAAQQTRQLAEYGIPWQGYLWCYWGESVYEHWQRVQEHLAPNWPGYHKLGIWLDMEDPVMPGQRALEWVGAYASMLRADGFVPGVYTGLWWLQRNSQEFEGDRGRYWSQYPLWWASYGVTPECRPAGIGPWPELALHQYQSVERGAELSSYDLSLICNVP